LAAVLRRYGLGLSEYRALALLAAAPQRELRILDLADALHLNQSSVSRLVGRLEATTLVRRETCGDDRRGVFTVLTDEGAGRHERLAPAYQAALAEAVNRAGGTDPGIAAVTAAVREAFARI